MFDSEFIEICLYILDNYWYIILPFSVAFSMIMTKFYFTYIDKE
jgi:hypothetical protein